MLLLAVIALVWLTVALTAVALCVYARNSDEEIAAAERRASPEITSAA